MKISYSKMFFKLPLAEQIPKLKGTLGWLILVVLFTIPSFATLLQPGYFPHHDDLQIMRIFEMDKCFKDLQLPCRWVPDMGYGYGYPLFNYYPVMPYYLGELIYFLTHSLIWSVKIDFILSLVVSALTMFFLARTFWGNIGGFVSSIFYVYAPYHAVDIYVRGAMAEGWSLAFTPAVFLSIYLVIKKGGLRNTILLAVFGALFLMSHNPMALIFTPIMAVWAGIFLILTKNYQSIKQLLLGAFWGLGLAAFFTIPVIVESSLVHLETLTIGYFNYLAHFVTLNQLFISRFWGYGGSIWGLNDGLSFQIGYLHWGGVLLTLLLALIVWKKDRVKSVILIYFFLIFWLAAFLMHQRSNPIWEVIPILQQIQFPWRILAVVIFSSSFMVGSIFSFKVNKYLVSTLLVSVIFGILFLYQGYFKIEKVVPLTDQEKLSDKLWDLQRAAGIFDYLPKTAKFPPPHPAMETVQVTSGSAVIKDFNKKTDSLSFSSSSTETATLRLPVIDFQNLKLFVDKKEIKFDNKNDLGQPTFQVNPGQHTITAKLYNTYIRVIANLISILSWGTLIYLVLKRKAIK